MKTVIVVVLLATLSLGIADPLPDNLLTLPPEKAGAMLANYLRTSVPAETVELSGRLRVRQQGKLQNIPITFRTEPGEPIWKSKYHTCGSNGITAESLVILHQPGQPNRYVWKQEGKDEVALGAKDAFRPFAGSDFWLIDLGLDFFHWPIQRIVKGEMFQHRYCYVLESRLSDVPLKGYSRVVAWVDKETGGPLKAAAYDGKGKLLKEFAIRKLGKVDGQWQLREMEISNLPANSKTTIFFDP